MAEFPPKSWVLASRSPRTLFRLSAGIVVVSVLLAFAISLLLGTNTPDLQDAGEQIQESIERIEKEMAEASAFDSSREPVLEAWRTGNHELALALLEDPEHHDAFAAWERMNIRADGRDYPGLAKDTLLAEIDSLLSPFAITAFLSALIWIAIMMAFWQPTRRRIGLAAAAFAAGIVSAMLTLYAVMVQERIHGFVENPEAPDLARFLYWIAGVALREESLKLLCFVPFAILIARRRNDLEALLLAGMIGLGFAFQENIRYFEGDPVGYTPWIRLLTANVLHFALTGIVGFHFYDTIRRKLHGIETFLLAFLGAVVAHGIYNAFQSIETYALWASFGPIAVAVMAYLYFDPLRASMDTTGIGRRISPLGVFVISSALLACLALVGSSLLFPFRFALGAFAMVVGSQVPLAFAFISRFRDL